MPARKHTLRTLLTNIVSGKWTRVRLVTRKRRDYYIVSGEAGTGTGETSLGPAGNELVRRGATLAEAVIRAKNTLDVVAASAPVFGVDELLKRVLDLAKSATQHLRSVLDEKTYQRVAEFVAAALLYEAAKIAANDNLAAINPARGELVASVLDSAIKRIEDKLNARR